MNWNIFKKADVESKDRIKCSKCHVYLPENYLEPKCEYCLGIKTRSVKVSKVSKVSSRSGPVQDLDLELHGSEPYGNCFDIKNGKLLPTTERRYTSTSDMKLKSGKCEGCGAVVPGLVSRFCINCSIKAIHYG